MNAKSYLLAACLIVALPVAAETMNKEQYKAKKSEIGPIYKSEKSACGKMSGNEKVICVETAKGKEKVAKAEVEYAYTNKPGDQKKIGVAKADAEYAVAKEQCDDKKGAEKSTCKSTAKTAHKQSVATAKA